MKNHEDHQAKSEIFDEAKKQIKVDDKSWSYNCIDWPTRQFYEFPDAGGFLEL